MSPKLPFDLKKSVTITSEDGVHENYSHAARRTIGLGSEKRTTVTQEM